MVTPRYLCQVSDPTSQCFLLSLQEGIFEDRLHRDIKLCPVPFSSHPCHLSIPVHLPQAAEQTSGKNYQSALNSLKVKTLWCIIWH